MVGEATGERTGYRDHDGKNMAEHSKRKKLSNSSAAAARNSDDFRTSKNSSASLDDINAMLDDYSSERFLQNRAAAAAHSKFLGKEKRCKTKESYPQQEQKKQRSGGIKRRRTEETTQEKVSSIALPTTTKRQTGTLNAVRFSNERDLLEWEKKRRNVSRARRRRIVDGEEYYSQPTPLNASASLKSVGAYTNHARSRPIPNQETSQQQKRIGPDVRDQKGRQGRNTSRPSIQSQGGKKDMREHLRKLGKLQSLIGYKRLEDLSTKERLLFKKIMGNTGCGKNPTKSSTGLESDSQENSSSTERSSGRIPPLETS